MNMTTSEAVLKKLLTNPFILNIMIASIINRCYYKELLLFEALSLNNVWSNIFIVPVVFRLL